MKMRFWLALTLIVPITALAANTYVSDDLVITLRTGQGNQYQIIKTLKSGTKLTVLQQTNTGYTQVRTSDGTEGWVRTQYLSDTPTAAIKLERAEAKLAKLQDTLSKTQTALSELQKEKATLDNQYSQLTSKNKSTTAELEKLSKIAAHPKQLADENADLQQKYAKITSDYNLLKQENQVLKDRSKRSWFMVGAGVVFFGIIIGLIIPKLRIHRKSSWDF